jgi:phosphate starvation-inducible membrane PsiE
MSDFDWLNLRHDILPKIDHNYLSNKNKFCNWLGHILGSYLLDSIFSKLIVNYLKNQFSFPIQLSNIVIFPLFIQLFIFNGINSKGIELWMRVILSIIEFVYMYVYQGNGDI